MTKTNFWSLHPLADQVEAPDPAGKALEIFGYTDRISYAPCERVRLHVHTSAATYSVRVVRDDLSGEVLHRASGLRGVRQQTPPDMTAATHGCDWTCGLEIALDARWRPGPYVIVLQASDASGETVEREAFFVVRNIDKEGRSHRLAMVLTTSTWTAYNDWGGANSYRSTFNGESVDVLAPVLSVRRPWARGLVRLEDGAPRHADAPDLPRHSPPAYPWVDWAFEKGYTRHYMDAGWAYYERPFFHWALKAGYHVDLLTQDDLHTTPGCLDGYASAVMVGHDEYWTWEMRDTMEAYVQAGGHLARFAGNMLWQVRKDLETGTQHCYKVPFDDPIYKEFPERATTSWDYAETGRPAAATFGLTAAAGCYHRFGACTPRASGGYTLYRPDHWSVAGTDLYYGDIFGAGTSKVLGFEVDGADFGFKWGQPFATGEDGAPTHMEIVAMAPATMGEIDRHGGVLNAPLDEALGLMAAVPGMTRRPPENREYGAAMMVSFTSGKGEVFNAGCCEWVTGLIRADADVEQITRNVFDRFLQKAGR